MMDINAAVDMVGGWDKNKPKQRVIISILEKQNLDLMLQSIQVMRGTLLIAAHNEGGKYFSEIHEAKLPVSISF